MNQKSNKYIKAQYQLFDATDGRNELIEETSDERPFDFVSGLNMLLPEFERQLEPLTADEHFDFMLTPEQAYGEYVEARVVNLDKQLFTVNGSFDARHVHVGAILPLQNADGQRFNGRVLSITDDKVRMDLNHPLAGKTLHFVGRVIDSHEATGEEISQYVKIMTDDECGGGCEGCGGGCHGGCHGGEHHDCGHHDEQEGHHCCGHHHGEGEEHHCCGHHHGESGEHCCGHNH